MPGSDGLGFLVILNKSRELRFGLRRSELIFWTWVRQVQLFAAGCTRVRWLSQWVKRWRLTNHQHRKIVSLSSRVENLNLKKVIKVSYLYQESRQCFVFFRFLYLWTLWTFLHVRIIAILQWKSQAWQTTYGERRDITALCNVNNLSIYLSIPFYFYLFG